MKGVVGWVEREGVGAFDEMKDGVKGLWIETSERLWVVEEWVEW